MLTQLDLDSKGQGHSKNQKTMPLGAINMPSPQKKSRVTGVQLICQIYDLFTIKGKVNKGQE